jgi:hypothetical protein
MQTSSVVPIQDIHALSHEVAEWLNDPFINNVVPPYTNGEGTGCDTIMETGDQLVGNTVPVTINGFTYTPRPRTCCSGSRVRRPRARWAGSLSVPGRSGRAEHPRAALPVTAVGCASARMGDSNLSNARS